LKQIQTQLRRGKRLWLLLDYDGTLVPIARTPAEAQPDSALLDLLTRLTQHADWSVAIVSGRPLTSLKAMLPVPQLILAGLYGVEIKLDNHILTRVTDPRRLQDKIQEIKTVWARLIEGHAGFWIEDKGLALALHGRFANQKAADELLPQARAAAEQAGIEGLRVLDGERFLEIAPASASKSQTVDWLLKFAPVQNALPVYLGDDDKDEEAFGTIHQHGGIAIIVGTHQANARVDARLPNPAEARRLLDALVASTMAPTLPAQ
jgi:trehalose 6-phosphate phosphatase